MSPERVLEIFKKISDEECAVMGMLMIIYIYMCQDDADCVF